MNQPGKSSNKFDAQLRNGGPSAINIDIKRSDNDSNLGLSLLLLVGYFDESWDVHHYIRRPYETVEHYLCKYAKYIKKYL